MKSRYRVKLDDVQMDSLNDNLLILDVGYSSPESAINSIKSAGLDGYDLDTPYADKTTVTVTFELHIYNIAERNAACQAINKWASEGGVLTVSDRSGQQLRDVRCEQYASIESVRNWTDPLTIVFATTYVPYWRSASKTLNLSGKSAKGTLKMDGNIGSAPVSVNVTAEANVTSFKIVVGSTNIELGGLALTKGQTLVIDYVRSRYLRIRAEGKSVMNLLRPTSSDRLMAPCGANTSVSITANNKVTVTVSARGMWI